MIKNCIIMLSCFILAACMDNWDSTNLDNGPYALTFSLDSSFQALYGNQPIRIALVRLTDGVVVAEDSGFISTTDYRAFTFRTAAVMERKVSYAVHYWIDSNIGGGTVGVCDPTDNDMQWSVEFFSVINDINFVVRYVPGLVEYVCDTFP